jgi:hypothetical protein
MIFVLHKPRVAYATQFFCEFSVDQFAITPSSGMLGLVVKSVPGIIIIGREHMPGPDKAGEVVMAIEVQIAVALHEPGATAGATGHIAGDGDHRATTVRRAFA